MQPGAEQSVAVLNGLISGGREAEAVAMVRALVDQAPDYGAGWRGILALCDRLGDEDTALSIARKVGEADPEDITAQVSYARRLARLGRMQDALGFMHAICTHDPDQAAAACQYGYLLAQAGEFTEAETWLRRAIATDPTLGDAWVYLSAFTDFSGRDADIATLRARAAQHANQPAFQFALGKALDDAGDSDGAMQAWDQANRRTRASHPFDPRLLQLMDSLPARFASLAPGFAATAPSQPRAVFIVGAPRTGTSLVEQILSAHPGVHGLGESLISRVATWPLRHLSPPDVANFESLGPVAWQQIGQIYTALAKVRAGDAAVVTDKAAALDLFTGVLARALPDARFVWVSRQPEAAALSAYRAYFGVAHPWSTRLQDAFAYLDAHDRLMRHWASLLGERMLVLSYEALAESPDTEIARLLEFAGLSHDPACFAFHDNPRAVQTASLGQVRQPMSVKPIDAWRRYAAKLAAAKSPQQP